jgi:hypothetical protein
MSNNNIINNVIDLTMNDKIIFKRKYFELDTVNNYMRLNLMYDGNKYIKLDHIVLNVNSMENIKLGNIELNFHSFKISYPILLFNITQNGNIKIDLSNLVEYGLGNIPVGLLSNSFKIEIAYEGNIESGYLDYSSIVDNSMNSINNLKIKTFDSDYIKSSNDVVIKNLQICNLVKKIEIYSNNDINLRDDFDSVMLMLDNVENNNFNLEIDNKKITMNFFTPINFNNYENIKLAVVFKNKKERELVFISSYSNDNNLSILNGKCNLTYLNYVSNIKYLVNTQSVNNSTHSVNNSMNIINDLDYIYLTIN